MRRTAFLALVLAAAPALADRGGRAVKEDIALYSFNYAYPAAVAAIPRLKARLDADIARQRAKLAGEAREAAADARKNGWDYHKYERTQSWAVVTDIPGWLSLSADYWTYTGGAHGMSWSGAMLWDRKAGVPRNPLDLFASKAALAAAIRAPFCAALDEQRAQKRGVPVKRASGEEFDKCIDPVAETVILGSRGKQKFDRIGILVAPYSAGPYVEGSYEVTVPVTPAVVAAVKPAYRTSFAVAK